MVTFARQLPAILHMNHCSKHIILYLTMVAFAITTFSKSIIILNFYINRQVIAQQFCVNKDKPMMHCNGHCYLKKQLQNEQQQEQALADAFGKNEVIVCEQRFSGIPDEFCNESVLTPDPFILRKTSLYQRLIDKRLLKPPIF
jgi:hypothetical protein